MTGLPVGQMQLGFKRDLLVQNSITYIILHMHTIDHFLVKL